MESKIPTVCERRDFSRFEMNPAPINHVVILYLIYMACREKVKLLFPFIAKHNQLVINNDNHWRPPPKQAHVEKFQDQVQLLIKLDILRVMV